VIDLTASAEGSARGMPKGKAPIRASVPPGPTRCQNSSSVVCKTAHASSNLPAGGKAAGVTILTPRRNKGEHD
jgi:hypothetical protein